MSKVFLLAAVMLIGSAASAQFFQKSAVPGSAVSHGFNANAAIVPTTQDFIKPLIGISASVSSGAALDGGFGVSFQHSKSDAATNSWQIQYSISALAFIGTNGKQITGTGGIIFGIPGTGGMIQVGPGYDFTNKQIVLLTGVGIPIF